MEKYGVEDVKEQQRAELDEVKARIQELRSNLEKTAAEDQQLLELEHRAADLQAALDQ